MTLMPIEDAHISVDEKGVPWVRRAGVSVKQVVASLKDCGFQAEEVVRQFPYLKISEVYSVLAYYHDHREEIELVLQKDREFADKLRAQTPEAPVTTRLRQAGKLP